MVVQTPPVSPRRLQEVVPDSAGRSSTLRGVSQANWAYVHLDFIGAYAAARSTNTSGQPQSGALRMHRGKPNNGTTSSCHWYINRPTRLGTPDRLSTSVPKLGHADTASWLLRRKPQTSRSGMTSPSVASWQRILRLQTESDVVRTFHMGSNRAENNPGAGWLDVAGTRRVFSKWSTTDRASIWKNRDGDASQERSSGPKPRLSHFTCASSS